MTTALALAEIQDKVHAATEPCWDEVTTMGSLATRYDSSYDLDGPGDMTRVARHELLAKAGVPTKYNGRPFFDMLRGETQRQVLLEIVANRGLWDKDVLARWHHDTLRAVVSDNYTCVPHTAVVDALCQIGTPLEVKSFYPEAFDAATKTMHIRMTTPTVHTLGADNDIGFCMVHVANSEVGASSLIVDVGIWREVCTNGLLARVNGAMILRERHLYKDPAELLESFSDAVSQAEEVAAKFVAKLEYARTVRVEPERILAQLPSEQFREVVRAEMEDESLFGVYNAITAAAQSRVFSAQYELEKWASRLLNNPGQFVAPDHIHIGEPGVCSECGRGGS